MQGSHDNYECAIFVFFIDIISGQSISSSKKDDLSNSVSILIPPDNVTKAFKSLWSCQTIQAAYMQGSKFQLNDSTEYFMNSVDRVCHRDYVATNDDILRARVRTTQISKIEFAVQGHRFEMIDIGGQRGQQKKWIHHFDNVTAVLFVVSISEYDQFLEEDQSINRMVESMRLFEQTLNNEHFWFTPFIVFFNKYDLFLEKIEHKSLKETFLNYNGLPYCAHESLNWLVHAYLSVDQTDKDKRKLYPHITTATDTHLIKSVFNSVQNSILMDVLMTLL